MIDILDECKAILEDRGRQYGSADELYRSTAKLINGYVTDTHTGLGVDAADVCVIMALVKIGRLSQGIKNKDVMRDTYIDAINYLVLAEGLDN